LLQAAPAASNYNADVDGGIIIQQSASAVLLQQSALAVAAATR